MFENPTKVFPCDCMGEGIAVTKEYDKDDISEGEVAVSVAEELNDCQESPYIQLSFWEFGHHRHGRWSLWQRLKMAYQIAFKNRGPWEDMIILRAETAKSFANRILYLIAKGEREKKLGEPIVKDDLLKSKVDFFRDKVQAANEADGELVHPYFCVKHGGSAACEESNKKHGFTCPKCAQNGIVDEIKDGSTE